jgi:hypothetical protein
MEGIGYQGVLDATSKPMDDGTWSVIRAGHMEERLAAGFSESVFAEHRNSSPNALMN